MGGGRLRERDVTGQGLRLAVVGYGAWGAVLARVLARNPRFAPPNFVTGNPAAGSAYPLARVFPTVEDLLAVDLPDGVIVATEPNRHLSICLRCLEKSIPCFVEKPVALSVGEVEALRSASARHGVGIHVDYVHRHNPSFRALLDALPRIAPLRELRSEGGNDGPVREGYSALWDFGPHDASMILAVIDREPIVTDCTATVSTGDGASYEIAFQAGALIGSTRVGNDFSEKVRRFSVTGVGGTLTYDELASAPLTLDDRPLSVPPDDGTPLDRALDRFADMIDAGGTESLFLEESIAITNFLAAAERAAA